MAGYSDFLDWLRLLADVYDENRQYLTELDAAIGDADHGINLSRGFTAVKKALENENPIPGAPLGEALPALFKNVSMTLIKTVGGASGPLLGTFFLKASAEAASAGDAQEMGGDKLAALFGAGAEGVKMRGRAEEGDKTMLDTWMPAIKAMKEEAAKGVSAGEVLEKGEAAAREGMEKTKMMKALRGRASYLGERSIGHIDPGAASSWMMIRAARETLGR